MDDQKAKSIPIGRVFAVFAALIAYLNLRAVSRRWITRRSA